MQSCGPCLMSSTCPRHGLRPGGRARDAVPHGRRADDVQDFIHGNRDKLNWRMMFVYEPDWLTAMMFEDAVVKGKARLGEPPASLRLESFHEGLSAQIMNVGPNSGEAPTLVRLHREFLPARGLVPRDTTTRST